MKFLLDPVYTGKPSTCSTSFLMMEVIKSVAKAIPDSFFYLLVPDKFMESKKEKEFLAHERVKLIPRVYEHMDRFFEMNQLDRNLMNLISSNGECWDTDVVISSRIQQLLSWRVGSKRSIGKDHVSDALFIGLEEYPLTTFRNHPWNWYIEPLTLLSYMQSDGMLINNLWSKDLIRTNANNWFKPSKVKRILDNIHEVTPVELQKINIKKVKNKNCITVGFAGRMTSTRNFRKITKIFNDIYSYNVAGRSEGTRFIISTNSKSSGATQKGDISFADVQHNSRVEFHDFLKMEADVVINLSPVEDFSLSTYEPLLYGVPVIVSDRPWTNFLGDDYPFRAKDTVTAYAMLKDFQEDYIKEYKKFTFWVKKYWEGFIKNQRREVTSAKLIDIVTKKLKDKKPYYTLQRAKTYKPLIDSINGHKGYLDLNVVLSSYGYRVPGKMTGSRGRHPNHQILRRYLLQEGYVDTKAPGVLVK